MIRADRYGRAGARNSSTCSNRKTIARRDLETRVLGGLRDRLMHPDLIREFIAEFQREMQQERLSHLSERAGNERRVSKVLKDIDGLLTAITDGMYHPSMKAKMDTLEDERVRLEGAPRGGSAPEPVALHSGLAGVYVGKVSDYPPSGPMEQFGVSAYRRVCG